MRRKIKVYFLIAILLITLTTNSASANVLVPISSQNLGDINVRTTGSFFVIQDISSQSSDEVFTGISFVGRYNFSRESCRVNVEGRSGSQWIKITEITVPGSDISPREFYIMFSEVHSVSAYSRIRLTTNVSRSTSLYLDNFVVHKAAYLPTSGLINQAVNAANAAKSSADTAATRAQTTINQTWYGGGSLNGTEQNVADITAYIRNTQLPGLENKINNLETTVNNIQNIDNTPLTVDVQTVSGARATSGSSIDVIVTTNKSGPLTYSINGDSYASLPHGGRVSLPVTSSGSNAITVSVQDDSGNKGSKTIVIRKL